LFNDPKLLEAKIMEEASELCEASSKTDVAAEAADLFYFALVKCIAAEVTLEDIEHNLDYKSLKTTRRKGDAKKQWMEQVRLKEVNGIPNKESNGVNQQEIRNEAASRPEPPQNHAGTIDGKIQMRRFKVQETDPKTLEKVLQRPSQRSTQEIMRIVSPIIEDVRQNGDSAVLGYTHKFEKATSLTSPVLKAPFAPELMELAPETVEAIDISFENIRRFHEAQRDVQPLEVETMPGVVCSRFSRPIERVGLYVPGGTAVLPSTAMMLGVPAMVAGCNKIVMASPPRGDGTITPEIIYVAHKVGAESIVLAGGAQAVAAMAYGTESISKVDKILGPGNQFVTAGKMLVSNDTSAAVSIDMPAGPSEVLVIADQTANPSFVASDLLSQAEHGTDSQVILIAVNLNDEQLAKIETELHQQANALPRLDIVRGAIEHSVTLIVENITDALTLSNRYAPEHLILQVDKADTLVHLVQNAGSVFIGPWTPESVGDYSAGVNHSLRKSTFRLVCPSLQPPL
jgi:phosphoribosyl-ATP pyrophosphohydrolase/phosphoribosyl-AMP cyclohydrolase/histidinol dehydrogenase